MQHEQYAHYRTWIAAGVLFPVGTEFLGRIDSHSRNHRIAVQDGRSLEAGNGAWHYHIPDVRCLASQDQMQNCVPRIGTSVTE